MYRFSTGTNFYILLWWNEGDFSSSGCFIFFLVPALDQQMRFALCSNDEIEGSMTSTSEM